MPRPLGGSAKKIATAPEPVRQPIFHARKIPKNLGWLAPHAALI
jgi:hypothetical protein